MGMVTAPKATAPAALKSQGREKSKCTIKFNENFFEEKDLDLKLKPIRAVHV